MAILEVKGLTKKFGDFTAVDNITFEIPEGKIVGLLGPNGAGKTTTIQMLMGVTLATRGQISYFGREFFANREYCLSRLNFTSSFNSLQGRLSVWENLVVFAHLYGVDNHSAKILSLARRLEFEDILHTRYWDVSAGQKTRVNIAKSLLNDPKLVLMDEPTAALDPDISDKVLSFIEELRQERKISILYTSHEMEEVTRVCDEVIFLQAGKIVAADTPLGLTKRFEYARLQLTLDTPKATVERFLVKKGLNYKFIADYIVRIKVKEQDIPRVIFDFGKAKIWITDIEVDKPSLEDVFMQFARVKGAKKHE